MTTTDFELPAFSAIRIANIEPVLRELLDAHRAQLQALVAAPGPTWDSLVVPLEEMHHRLARTWSPVGHMNGVVNSDELRTAYNACLPLLTSWHTELAQNEQLYRAYETILTSEGEDAAICKDGGAPRAAVHARLAALIRAAFDRALAKK